MAPPRGVPRLKQKLTTVAKITNVSEYILLFGLLGYAATKLWNTANWLRRKAWEETGKIPNYNQQAKDGIKCKSNRIHRGLYVCQNCGRTINADLNGAINILKKYLQREGISEGVVGEVARPLVNLFVQRKTELKSREQGTFLKKAA